MAVAAIVPIIMAVAAVASTAVAVKSSEDQEAQAHEQSDIASAQAVQQETQRQGQIAATIATQTAMRSSGGLDPFSGTGANIRATSLDAGNRDLNTLAANGLAQQRQFGLAADNAGNQKFGSIAGGIGQIASTPGISNIFSGSTPAPQPSMPPGGG